VGEESELPGVRVLAPAKVNLSLFLGPTREDGRHQLVTLFQSLSLCDVLVVRALPGVGHDRVVCKPEIEGENLAARAIAALRERGWDGPTLAVSITKNIPIAAGMAGGSADAAAVLRAAMAIAPDRTEEVEAIAAGLGADVPAQLLPGVSLGTGAGEVVERLAPLAAHAYAVLPSPFSLSTPDVYREADRLGLARPASVLAERNEELRRKLTRSQSPAGPPAPAAAGPPAPAAAGPPAPAAAGPPAPPAAGPPVRPPDELLVNDLEPAAISLQPWCAAALADLRAAGAEHAMVSGSGPTVVGIWWGPEAATRALHAVGELGERYPGAVAARPVDAQFALPSLT
jgi:4-diphosphocytidyl-2-C-methyl-D-erythritol kinase